MLTGPQVANATFKSFPQSFFEDHVTVRIIASEGSNFCSFPDPYCFPSIMHNLRKRSLTVDVLM